MNNTATNSKHGARDMAEWHEQQAHLWGETLTDELPDDIRAETLALIVFHEAEAGYWWAQDSSTGAQG